MYIPHTSTTSTPTAANTYTGRHSTFHLTFSSPLPLFHLHINYEVAHTVTNNKPFLRRCVSEFADKIHASLYEMVPLNFTSLPMGRLKNKS